jgi:hypothetical protein
MRGSSELVASGRHPRFAAFPYGSPLLVHLMSEQARILPFNSSAFVGRAPLVVVPQTGDRLLPVLARIGAGLKIGFLSCTPPSACTPARCVLLAPARAATSCSTSSRTPPCARSRRTCAAPVLTSPRFNATEPPPRRLTRPPEAARAVGSRAHPSTAPPAPPAHASAYAAPGSSRTMRSHGQCPPAPCTRAAPPHQSSARPNARAPTPRSALPSRTTRQRAHAPRSAPRTPAAWAAPRARP